MAKGQKTSNKEVRKPKAVKAAPAAAASPLSKGATSPVSMPEEEVLTKRAVSRS